LYFVTGSMYLYMYQREVLFKYIYIYFLYTYSPGQIRPNMQRHCLQFITLGLKYKNEVKQPMSHINRSPLYFFPKIDSVHDLINRTERLVGVFAIFCSIASDIMKMLFLMFKRSVDPSYKLTW
jgi:hypothetical protein